MQEISTIKEIRLGFDSLIARMLAAPFVVAPKGETDEGERIKDVAKVLRYWRLIPNQRLLFLLPKIE